MKKRLFLEILISVLNTALICFIVVGLIFCYISLKISNGTYKTVWESDDGSIVVNIDRNEYAGETVMTGTVNNKPAVFYDGNVYYRDQRDHSIMVFIQSFDKDGLKFKLITSDPGFPDEIAFHQIEGVKYRYDYLSDCVFAVLKAFLFFA